MNFKKEYGGEAKAIITDPKLKERLTTYAD